MIQLTPRSRIDEFARAEYARHFDSQATEPVRTVNFGAVLGLMDDGLLAFRGRVYRSPPVSYVDAVRLWELIDRMARLAASTEGPGVQMRAISEIQREAIRLFALLATPIDWRRFVPRRLRPNPFRNASPREVDELLGFFFKRQTASSVRHSGQTASSGAN